MNKSFFLPIFKNKKLFYFNFKAKKLIFIFSYYKSDKLHEKFHEVDKIWA